MAGCATSPKPQTPVPSKPVTEIAKSPELPPTINRSLETPPQEKQPQEKPHEQIPKPLPRPATSPIREAQTIHVSGFEALKFWQSANPVAAFSAFQKTCALWARRKEAAWLNEKRPQFGRVKDYLPACNQAKSMGEQNIDRVNTVQFFQNYFEPLTAEYATQPQHADLLTGYYAPQIEVRENSNAVFSAPILARPTTLDIQNLPRKALGATSSQVLAYGRPADVFFMQIQGSGNIAFPDGRTYRAAFDGHNNKKYRSIGAVLIRRGEMTREQASKQAIENWMQNAGPKAAQDLMNENPRYIFFKQEALTDKLDNKKGPTGAGGVPLTAMGSLAVDPRFIPYGTLIWLEVNLPQNGGDFTGAASGLLVVAQDTGSAINGARRGDLYFGEGNVAGGKAGVMKHKAQWTILLPTALAFRAKRARLRS